MKHLPASEAWSSQGRFPALPLAGRLRQYKLFVIIQLPAMETSLDPRSKLARQMHKEVRRLAKG